MSFVYFFKHSDRVEKFLFHCDSQISARLDLIFVAFPGLNKQKKVFCKTHRGEFTLFDENLGFNDLNTPYELIQEPSRRYRRRRPRIVKKEKVEEAETKVKDTEKTSEKENKETFDDEYDYASIE